MPRFLTTGVILASLLVAAALIFSPLTRPQYALAAFSSSGVVRMNVRSGALEICTVKNKDLGYAFDCYNEVGGVVPERLPSKAVPLPP